MTTAPHLSFGQTTQAIDDASYSIFQIVNAPLSTQLVCGNFFLGLQASIAVVIPMGSLLGLARGADIETDLSDVVVAFQADGSWTAGGEILCNVMLDTGPRVTHGDPPVDTRLAWKPPQGMPQAWRRDFSGLFDHRLEDTGGTPFVDTGLGNSGVFGIRSIVGKREQMAQRFTVPVGPSWSVARAVLEMRRHGAPIGSMAVAIQGDVSDGFGHVEPDGIDLGVSAAVLNSTIPLTPGSGAITYAFTPDVVLPPGDYWTVIRPVVSYPVSAVDYVVWLQRRLFIAGGGSHLTPNGVRLDLGNFPGHVDMSFDLGVPKQAGADVVWNPIARSPGQNISTPDLSPLVQEVIKTAGHETIHAMCFTFKTVGETRSYRFAAHGHPTRTPPGFGARFRRRDIGGQAT